MSKVFEKIPQEVKKELNEWYNYIPIDFEEDGEFYEILDNYNMFDDVKRADDIYGNMSIFKDYDDFCDRVVDDGLFIDIPDGEAKKIIMNYFDYEGFYDGFAKLNWDIHELSNDVIVNIY